MYSKPTNAKNLRYCRERDRTQDRINRILYENMENRYLDKEWREKASSGAAFKFEVQGRKSINTAKLDYSPNPNDCRLQNCWWYGTEWTRWGEMKLEENIW